MSTETIRLIRDGEKGVWRWGERDIIYLSLHCHHQNVFCIKMGSDERHFNVSVESDGQSHKTVSTDHSLGRERRAEAVSNRGPSAYHPNALPLSQTGSRGDGPSAQGLTLQIIRAIKLPPSQKRERTTGKKRLKGHGPGHTMHSVTKTTVIHSESRATRAQWVCSRVENSAI